jgi:hypothetical protein
MRRLICLTAAVTMLLAPAAAHADGGAAVIRDCANHGRITGHYTQKQYAQALAELPADVSEYSDCAALIRAAQLAAAGGHSGGGGGGGASPSNALATASPSERAALRAASRTGSRPFDIGGRLVQPGVVAVRSSSVFNALPTPLLIALAALLATALGAGGHRVWTIVRARR